MATKMIERENSLATPTVGLEKERKTGRFGRVWDWLLRASFTLALYRLESGRFNVLSPREKASLRAYLMGL